VTVQLANELKGEGFTVIAMHPGGRCSLLLRSSALPMACRAVVMVKHFSRPG